MSILYHAHPLRGNVWKRLFAELAPDLKFHVGADGVDLNRIEYLIAWEPSLGLLRSLAHLKVVFSLGAGIDHMDLAAVPPHVAVVRMIEPGLDSGMIEYVTMGVLALHRQLPGYLAQQGRREWCERPGGAAATCGVGVMGLGVLGRAVLERLATFGYRLHGWSTTHKTLAGVHCYTGPDALGAFLAQCDILICLLPLTDETRGILDARLFAALPKGASVVNVGRGAHLDAHALLAALESGQVAHAILDVADPEPLPPAHPFWTHARIWMTPHIASITQPETAARVVVDNLRRHQRGEPLQGMVNRARGY